MVELGRPGPQHLAHDLARDTELTRDRLDRLPLNKMRAANLRNRFHYLHPRSRPAVVPADQSRPPGERGSFWTPITP